MEGGREEGPVSGSEEGRRAVRTLRLDKRGPTTQQTGRPHTQERRSKHVPRQPSWRALWMEARARAR